MSNPTIVPIIPFMFSPIEIGTQLCHVNGSYTIDGSPSCNYSILNENNVVLRQGSVQPSTEQWNDWGTNGDVEFAKVIATLAGYTPK